MESLVINMAEIEFTDEEVREYLISLLYILEEHLVEIETPSWSSLDRGASKVKLLLAVKPGQSRENLTADMYYKDVFKKRITDRIKRDLLQ
jgi:hypothetical protein